MNNDIFISYSNKDKSTVHKYAQYLERIGYRVWYDVKGLYTGVQFSEEIVTAIENSRLFIYFSSKNSNDSEWTKGEILTAQKFKKQILPVRLDAEEYDKAIMLVLLPLQYVVINNNFEEQSCKELLHAIENFIGKPLQVSKVGNEEKHLPYSTPRKNCKQALILSILASILLSLFMMMVSGEYWLNYSLAFFTTVVSSICCSAASAYIIYIEKFWNERVFSQNLLFIIATLFFLSYSVMAFGLCFVSLGVFLLNSPSIVCATLAIYSLFLLMEKKKKGLKILWISAALFSIGSYWWLGGCLEAPFIIAIASLIGMYSLKTVLKKDNNGYCYWDNLQ